jgi:hypothetical protein
VEQQPVGVGTGERGGSGGLGWPLVIVRGRGFGCCGVGFM